MRCLKNSSPASCLTRSWGRAKRLTAALLAALALAAPAFAQEEKKAGEDGALEEIEKIIVYGDLQQITQSIWELLEISPEDDPVCQDGWYLHPKGFAFQIPDGMTLLENYRGTTVMLVDKADGDAVFSTSISVAMAGEDKELDKLTREKVEAAYGAEFDDFSLVYCRRKPMFGQEEVVNICFLAGQSPRLLFEQRMLNHGGHSFVVTMTAEYDNRKLPEAWAQYDAFCGSLSFFTQETEEEP